jgi:hypothetical protein
VTTSRVVHQWRYRTLARPFGTADIAVILARITNGLRCARPWKPGSALARQAAGTLRWRPSVCPPHARHARQGRPRRRTLHPTLSPPIAPRTRVSRAISHAIMMYGGSLTRFLHDLGDRMFAYGFGGHPGRADPGWPAAPPRLAAVATGPP